MPFILLFDDDAMLRPLSARMLAQRGGSVRMARSLAEAIAYAYAERFDVAVIDLGAGEPSKAQEAADALLQDGSMVGRVILCGAPPGAANDKVEVLPKPFDFERLAALVFQPRVRDRARSGVFTRAALPDVRPLRRSKGH